LFTHRIRMPLPLPPPFLLSQTETQESRVTAGVRTKAPPHDNFAPLPLSSHVLFRLLSAILPGTFSLPLRTISFTCPFYDAAQRLNRSSLFMGFYFYGLHLIRVAWINISYNIGSETTTTNYFPCTPPVPTSLGHASRSNRNLRLFVIPSIWCLIFPIPLYYHPSDDVYAMSKSTCPCEHVSPR